MAFNSIGLGWDDIIYLSMLLGSIGFGSVFRKIKESKDRKTIATILGIVVVTIVSGKHTVYPLISTTVNALIITFLDKKVVHKVSFSFSFLFLIFFRFAEFFGLPANPNPTNLIMMIMTLKMVGLAFEVTDANNYIKKLKLKDEISKDIRIIEIPSFNEIFHYGYCYLGVLAGPYYTYRTYCDLFITPFWKYAKCEYVALNRFKYLPLYGIVFLLISYYCPFDQAETSEFLYEKSLWYRLWFSYPAFIQFRMRMYIGMRLAEIVVIMGGLGAYPEICESATLGPTTNFNEITELKNNEEKAIREKYNFITVYSIEPYHTEFEYTVRASMKYWNMTVQCWLTKYIYLRSPKAYRTLLTFVVSAVWHGTSPGYFFAFISVALFLPVEDIYRRKSKQLQVPPWVSTLSWILVPQLKLYLFSYWTVPFRLLSGKSCWNYMSSVYFLPTFISVFGMYAASLIIFKNVKTMKSTSEKVAVNKME